VLKTTTRKVTTLAIGQFIARETRWWNPTTDQVCPAPALRRLVAPACNYGYDVVTYVGRALFLDAQPARQIIAELDRQHVHLSASTVTELGRRFIALLALAHRQGAPRLTDLSFLAQVQFPQSRLKLVRWIGKLAGRRRYSRGRRGDDA
jgi:hypothetical protein